MVDEREYSIRVKHSTRERLRLYKHALEIQEGVDCSWDAVIRDLCERLAPLPAPASRR